jgi:hypothetical protein
VLLAGSKQHIALASVEGNVGLNVAAGIGAVELTAVKFFPDRL